jgi:hypothetical protein
VTGESDGFMIRPRLHPRRAALAGLLLLAAPWAGAQQRSLFLARQPARTEDAWVETGTDTESETDPAGFRLSWPAPAEGGFHLHLEPKREEEGFAATTASPPHRLCVLFQCETLPIRPAPGLFTAGTSWWTAAGILIGIVDGIQGPINDGVHPFHFTDEGFFQYWTYGGGSDKASHCVISANVAGLLYDAYRLNGLTENQSFALAVGTTLVGGALVEVGDGLTPYGFSAQDLTADAVGALANGLVKRNHLDDLIGFQLGKVPTTIPADVIGGRPLSGIDYSQEIYGVQMKFGGLARRLHSRPGVARFFQSSFVFLTKGFGYEPPLPSRYQEVGLEIGLDFPEILRAVGVDDATWWGSTLLRIFGFLRIPFTQIGAYYNFTSGKWYGPGAPDHYY